MKNGKIGYAVVGLGIGKAHVDAAAASKKCELVAVCDLIQAKMDKVVERYPGTKTYLEFDEMVRKAEVPKTHISQFCPYFFQPLPLTTSRWVLAAWLLKTIL